MKTSDLGSPEAERVFCRSATTSLVSSFLSASVAGHCQRSMKMFLCSNVLRRTMWWVELSYAPQFYLFHNSGVPSFQICLSFLLPQSWHTWLIICSHGDFPAPPSLTFSNYLGQTEPNFGYGKERKAVHPSSCEVIVLCQSWWSPFNSTVTALWTPWTFLPPVNEHLGWGLANKQSPSAATSVSVPEDISTFVKFGVTGDFPHLYHSLSRHILQCLLPAALLHSAVRQMSRTLCPFHTLPSSATPPGLYHRYTGYPRSRVCRELLPVGRLWCATYLSGSLFLIERLNRKVKKHYEKFKTEMSMSKTGKNIVGGKKGSYKNLNLSSLLISHNTLQDVPEAPCSAELLESIESLYTTSFAKWSFKGTTLGTSEGSSAITSLSFQCNVYKL